MLRSEKEVLECAIANIKYFFSVNNQIIQDNLQKISKDDRFALDECNISIFSDITIVEDLLNGIDVVNPFNDSVE